MAVHLICQCGYDITVPSSNSGATALCPSCGRTVQRESTSEPMPPANTEGPETQFFLANSANADSSFNNGETVLTLAVPQAEVADQLTKTLEAHDEDEFEFDIVDSAKVVAPVNDEETKWNSVPKVPLGGPPQVRSGSSTKIGSGSHISELDLSQRVMGQISRPSVPPPNFNAEQGGYGVHRIIRTHQKGGMGRIIIAYDQFLKRDIALKELHPEAAEEMSIVRRFVGEAEITAQLEHPGIVPIHMLGQDKNGFPYYTMKLIKGHTLQEAIKAYHRSPSKAELMQLVRRLVSICKTIAFAHNKGVIHRDLKPANIMLGEHGETLVMDWGLAKPIKSLQADELPVATVAWQHCETEPRPDLTMIGAIVGTPAFMAPEQAQPEKNEVGPLSDVFSLGTVLYYLLAGQTAFSGRSTQEVLSKVRAAAPPKPSEIKPNVPADLEAICRMAMAKNPKDRYPTATEFADDLCRWLDGEPVQARRDTFVRKILRWIDRHRIFTFSIPIALAAVVLLSSVSIYLDRTAREREAEEVVLSILNNPIDLTNQHLVLFRGGPGISVHRESQLPEGEVVVCTIDSVPTSQRGVVEILAPTIHAWDLSHRPIIQFSINVIDGEDIAKEDEFQRPLLSTFSLRIGRGSAYFEYCPKPEWWSQQHPDSDLWFTFMVHLDGSESWTKTVSGDPMMSQIEWLEFHFDIESVGSFKIDKVSFLE